MEVRENIVISFGSPLIDITVHIEADFLQRFNLTSNGVKSSDNRVLFQEILRKNPKYEPGGSITNTCLLLQSLLKHPKSVCYIGAIGNDKYGQSIIAELSQKQVNFLYEKIPDMPTGTCAVLLNNSNRSLVTDLGASRHITEEFIESIDDILKQGKLFYMSGYFFGVSQKISTKISNFAHENNKTIVFNIGAAFLCRKYPQEYTNIVPYINILIGNEEEVQALAQVFKCEETDLKANVQCLNGIRDKGMAGDVITIATTGSKNVMVANREKIFEFEVPDLQERRLNTNGAGDAFIAGFLAKYIIGETLNECVKNGIKISQDYIVSKSI